MADLATEVQTRIDTPTLVQLTNRGSNTATTVNTTLLAAAVADAQAEFGLLTGLTYDQTNALHTAVGVIGVHAFLLGYGDPGQVTNPVRDRWLAQLEQIAVSKGTRRRILPSTSSELEPSEEVDGTLPDFDRARWRQLTLDSPRPSDLDDFPRHT